MQIGDLSKIGLRQAQEFYFPYNLQTTIYDIFNRLAAIWKARFGALKKRPMALDLCKSGMFRNAFRRTNCVPRSGTNFWNVFQRSVVPRASQNFSFRRSAVLQKFSVPTFRGPLRMFRSVVPFRFCSGSENIPGFDRNPLNFVTNQWHHFQSI